MSGSEDQFRVLPCSPNPYPDEAWSYQAGEEARAGQLCGLLAAREAGDLAWLRRTVLSSGARATLLSPDVASLPSLWEWVLAQLDDHVSVVPPGWHGEWKDDAEARGSSPGFVRISFLAQAVVFHLAGLRRLERPGLVWKPYQARMRERDRWFLVPTLADNHIQLFPPHSLAFAMARASRWAEPDPKVRAVYRDPAFLLNRFVSPSTADPLPKKPMSSQRAASSLSPVRKGSPSGIKTVQPSGTTEENPREVYVYRSRNLLDGIDPARCSPIDPVRLPAGLKAMGFEDVEHDHPLEPEDGMLLSEWTLDRPDGGAVAYALIMTSPAAKLRPGGVRKVEVRIETEADEGMTAAERGTGTWWHAGVMAGLRQLADDLGARVVTREELEDADDTTN